MAGAPVIIPASQLPIKPARHVSLNRATPKKTLVCTRVELPIYSYPGRDSGMVKNTFIHIGEPLPPITRSRSSPALLTHKTTQPPAAATSELRRKGSSVRASGKQPGGGSHHHPDDVSSDGASVDSTVFPCDADQQSPRSYDSVQGVGMGAGGKGGSVSVCGSPLDSGSTAYEGSTLTWQDSTLSGLSVDLGVHAPSPPPDATLPMLTSVPSAPAHPPPPLPFDDPDSFYAQAGVPPPPPFPYPPPASEQDGPNTTVSPCSSQLNPFSNEFYPSNPVAFVPSAPAGAAGGDGAAEMVAMSTGYYREDGCFVPNPPPAAAFEFDMAGVAVGMGGMGMAMGQGGVGVGVGVGVDVWGGDESAAMHMMGFGEGGMAMGVGVPGVEGMMGLPPPPEDLPPAPSTDTHTHDTTAAAGVANEMFYPPQSEQQQHHLAYFDSSSPPLTSYALQSAAEGSGTDNGRPETATDSMDNSQALELFQQEQEQQQQGGTES